VLHALLVHDGVAGDEQPRRERERDPARVGLAADPAHEDHARGNREHARDLPGGRPMADRDPHE